MTEPVVPHPLKLDKDAQEVTARMRAIEAVFASNGLTTHLTDARAGLDLSAVLSPSASVKQRSGWTRTATWRCATGARKAPRQNRSPLSRSALYLP